VFSAARSVMSSRSSSVGAIIANFFVRKRYIERFVTYS
jgi:hypothetical protein